MFVPLGQSCRLKGVQKPLRMLWRGGIRRICNNNDVISSAISDGLGNRLAETTKCLFPAPYWLGIREYQTSGSPPLSYAHQLLLESAGDSALSDGYSETKSSSSIFLLLVDKPRPPLIDVGTHAARRLACAVSPIVVNLYYRQGNQILGQGAGTIIDPDGIILTCAHLLDSHGSADALKELKVAVTLDPSQSYSGKRLMGAVLYADFLYDIAIIKITPFAPLQAAKLGTARELCAGDVVLSAGRYSNSFFDGYPQFLAKGGRYVGGYGGMFGEILPVTCSVAEGSDGGPLFNCNGELIGVMTKKESSNSCAISIDAVSKALKHFKEHGRVVQPQLGVTIGNIQEGDDAGKCVLVVKVTPGSAGDRSGLLPGDVVTEFDGKSVGSFQEFINVMWDKVGKPLNMVVKRGTDTPVTLTVVPDEASLNTHDW